MKVSWATYRLWEVLSIAAVVVMLAAAGFWVAALPLINDQVDRVGESDSARSSPDASAAQPPIDASRFADQFWPAVTDVLRGPEMVLLEESELLPTEEPAAPVRSLSTSLQLLAILEERDGLKAAIFDPDSDRLHIAQSGTSVGALRVMSISRSGVRLSNDNETLWLALDRGKP